MTFDKWFEEQALWLKIVLLIIPFVGWVVELIIRWSDVIKDSEPVKIVLALLFTFLGWMWIPTIIDGILKLLGKKMLAR